MESVPGRVRMRLGEPPPEPPKKSGIIGWLERAAKTAPPPPTEPPIEPMEIDLHMTKKASQPQNRLELRVVCRALSGPLPNDPRWHARLKKLMIDLRGYVMAAVRGKALVTRMIELPQGPALLLDRELLKQSGLAPGSDIKVPEPHSPRIIREVPSATIK